MDNTKLSSEVIATVAFGAISIFFIKCTTTAMTRALNTISSGLQK